MGRGKRDQRKREKARTGGGSPYRLVGASGDNVMSFVNANWREEGLAGIHILKRIPGGGYASVSFLIDTWCCGLKDTGGRLDISYDEFMRVVHDPIAQHTEIAPIPIEEVRRLVAAGVRFAEQSGFRLPPHWERYASMIGGIGDWRNADLSDFGYEGGLHFVGTEAELRRRLIGQSVDSFLSREDVMVTFGDDESLDEAHEEEQQFDDMTDVMVDAIVEKIEKWCAERGKKPSPYLRDASELILMSMSQAPIVDESSGEPGAEGASPPLRLHPSSDEEKTEAIEDDDVPFPLIDMAAAQRNIHQALELDDPQVAAGIRGAVAQIRAMIQSLGDSDFWDGTILSERLGKPDFSSHDKESEPAVAKPSRRKPKKD